MSEWPAVPDAGARLCDTMLVVEDDEAIGMLLRVLLAPLVREVRHVRSAGECWRDEGARDGSLSLAIVDCGLPDVKDGALCQQLRAAMPGLPLLLISGTDHPALVAALAAGGPAEFLAKPFRPGAALTHMRRLLGARVAG